MTSKGLHRSVSLTDSFNISIVCWVLKGFPGFKVFLFGSHGVEYTGVSTSTGRTIK